MKTRILITSILAAGWLHTASAEICRDACGISVHNRQVVDLQRALRMGRHLDGEVITELGLTIDNAYRAGVAHFSINGIALGHLEIPADRDVQRIFLPLPFKVLYERGLDIDLALDGRMTLVDVGLSFSGDRFDRVPRPEVCPPEPVVEMQTIEPNRWATRYNGRWGERVQGLNDRGAGARDGWDYPNQGMIRDGRTANFRAGSQATLLHAYFPQLGEDYREDLTVCLTASGSGEAEVGIVSAGRTVRTQRVRLDGTLRSQEITFDHLHLERSALGRIEVWVKSPHRREMQVDAIELMEKHPAKRRSFAGYDGRR